MYTAIIESSIELAKEVFEYLNYESQRKYLKELMHLKDQLGDEKTKPYADQNDKIIETLERRVKNLQDLARLELQKVRNEKIKHRD